MMTATVNAAEILDEMLGQLLAVLDMQDDPGMTPAKSLRRVQEIVARAARSRGIEP